jgi:hypothetical protein
MMLPVCVGLLVMLRCGRRFRSTRKSREPREPANQSILRINYVWPNRPKSDAKRFYLLFSLLREDDIDKGSITTILSKKLTNTVSISSTMLALATAEFKKAFAQLLASAG